jgi:hypothetical protein
MRNKTARDDGVKEKNASELGACTVAAEAIRTESSAACDEAKKI